MSDLRNAEELARHPGRCAFPACDCPGESPVCEDYEETADEAIEARFLRGTDTEADRRMYVEGSVATEDLRALLGLPPTPGTV